MRCTPWSAFAAVAVLSAPHAGAQSVPTGFTIDTLATAGIQAPNDCCFLPDGRCLVANMAGQIVLWSHAGSAAIGAVPNVLVGSERGLLSIAADPAFAQNGYVYVWYASAAGGFLQLDRFTCSGDLALASSTNLSLVPATRRVVLAVPDLYDNHNGGSLRFGPDGMLYVSIGDDLNSCAAQTPTALLGRLLRLDVGALPAGGNPVPPPYAALDPGDNPLSGAPDASALLLALGLRNPFRFEIDPLTGNVYLGDVGWNDVEEYSEYVRPAGALPLVNFGWPWREGDLTGVGCSGAPPAGPVDPPAPSHHSGGLASGMGGARYRNRGGVNDFGSDYEGSAFYLAFYAGEVRRLVQVGGVWAPAPPVPGQPSATNWAIGFSLVTCLRLGPDGALWFTQRPGALKRLRPLGPPDSVVALGGRDQIGTAGAAFAPLAARVYDAQGNPRPNWPVTFTVAGPASGPGPAAVVTDHDGVARAKVLPWGGGAIAVTAAAPGTSQSATFALFARRLAVWHGPGQIVVELQNASPAAVPWGPAVLFASLGGPVVPTPLGGLCVDPTAPTTFVLEDSIGLFGGGSLSGMGMVGTPSVRLRYPLPTAALAGVQLVFQAAGFDPALGAFLTNCEPHLF